MQMATAQRSKLKYDPRNHTKSHERDALFRIASCDFVDRSTSADAMGPLTFECCFQRGPKFFDRQVTSGKNSDAIWFGLAGCFNRAQQFFRGTESGRQVSA